MGDLETEHRNGKRSKGFRVWRDREQTRRRSLAFPSILSGGGAIRESRIASPRAYCLRLPGASTRQSGESGVDEAVGVFVVGIDVGAGDRSQRSDVRHGESVLLADRRSEVRRRMASSFVGLRRSGRELVRARELAAIASAGYNLAMVKISGRVVVFVVGLVVVAATNVFADERRAVIDDPDGFTNVRAEPNAESAVVAKVKRGEVFTFTFEVSSRDSEWCAVTPASGKKGYMHADRFSCTERWRSWPAGNRTTRSPKTRSAASSIIWRWRARQRAGNRPRCGMYFTYECDGGGGRNARNPRSSGDPHPRGRKAGCVSAAAIDRLPGQSA